MTNHYLYFLQEMDFMMFKNLMFSVAFSLVFSFSESHAVKIKTINGEELTTLSPNRKSVSAAKTVRAKHKELNGNVRPRFNTPLMNQFLYLASPMNKVKEGSYLSVADIVNLMEVYPILIPSFIEELDFKNSIFAGCDLKTNQAIATEGLTRAHYDYFVQESKTQFDALVHKKKSFLSPKVIDQSAKSRITPQQLVNYQIWKSGKFQDLMTTSYDGYKGLINELNTVNPAETVFRYFSQVGAVLPSLEVWNNFTRFTSLTLSVKVTHINSLAGLTGLQSLWLLKSEIADIGGLSPLTQLRWLTLIGNNIADIRDLAGLTGLEILQLSNNKIANIKPLCNLTGLGILDLSNNKIANIKPLGNLTRLFTLRLSNNEITDIEDLAPLTELSFLDLDINNITNIGPLAAMTRLEKLNLEANPNSWKPMKKSRKFVDSARSFHKSEAQEVAIVRINANRAVVETLKMRNCDVKGVPGAGLFEIFSKVLGKDSHLLRSI